MTDVENQKPEPKYEIVITGINGSYLSIYCESPDAHNWILSEAPKFGNLEQGNGECDYWIHDIRPTFDKASVLKYLIGDNGLYIDESNIDPIILKEVE